MTTLEEVEVGLEKDNILVILAEMIEVVVVSQVGLEKDNILVIFSRNDRSSSSKSRSGSRTSTNRDRIRYFKCR